jgi:hypothetical protein
VDDAEEGEEEAPKRLCIEVLKGDGPPVVEINVLSGSDPVPEGWVKIE